MLTGDNSQTFRQASAGLGRKPTYSHGTRHPRWNRRPSHWTPLHQVVDCCGKCCESSAHSGSHAWVGCPGDELVVDHVGVEGADASLYR